jgi:hypothetical protein
MSVEELKKEEDRASKRAFPTVKTAPCTPEMEGSASTIARVVTRAPLAEFSGTEPRYKPDVKKGGWFSPITMMTAVALIAASTLGFCLTKENTVSVNTALDVVVTNTERLSEITPVTSSITNGWPAGPVRPKPTSAVASKFVAVAVSTCVPGSVLSGMLAV